MAGDRWNLASWQGCNYNLVLTSFSFLVYCSITLLTNTNKCYKSILNCNGMKCKLILIYHFLFRPYITPVSTLCFPLFWPYQFRITENVTLTSDMKLDHPGDASRNHQNAYFIHLPFKARLFDWCSPLHIPFYEWNALKFSV